PGRQDPYRTLRQGAVGVLGGQGEGGGGGVPRGPPPARGPGRPAGVAGGAPPPGGRAPPPIAAALAPLDLTHVQFVLLATTWWLNGQGEAPNQLGVARQAGTDVKMTSQVLRRLEDKGLIRREVDPADTRAKRLHVTSEGAALAQRAVSAVEEADAAFFRAVPDPAALLTMLRPLTGRHDTDGT
ncbi:MarR family transcriptional regulator, partial [Streptomyces sp. NPDC058964]|uniref:MarR family transcriptional regulator n=1 Tax=Streptomyces sp. NPDC058964 TaxID=3346681 RepID=UPI003678D85A